MAVLYIDAPFQTKYSIETNCDKLASFLRLKYGKYVLMNEEKAAWYYKRNFSEHMNSVWYDELRKDAVRKGMAEETRMLYVAMTRAVNKLILLVNDWDSYESWSSLIRKVGLINE